MIVVDTNILVYLSLPSAYSDAADRLYLSDPDWIAPLLWRSEMRSALTRHILQGIITLERARAIQDEMEDLLYGREYQLPSFDVLLLAAEGKASAYDCEFVALARATGNRLVTMDKKLVSAYPETAVLLTKAAGG